MYYCYGKKGVCDTDITSCATCGYFDNSGGYDLEEGRALTPDIQYIFDMLDKAGPSSDDYYRAICDLKKEFGYEV